MSSNVTNDGGTETNGGDGHDKGGVTISNCCKFVETRSLTCMITWRTRHMMNVMIGISGLFLVLATSKRYDFYI